METVLKRTFKDSVNLIKTQKLKVFLKNHVGKY